MKRVWHPYTLWEDWQAGMWRIVTADDERRLLPDAIEFTGDANLYGRWMLRVIVEWPIACEHNLTEVGMNRLAWIGHAATCLAIGCPEYITRQAWGALKDEQRAAANKKAEQALRKWELEYTTKNSPMGQTVGSEGLPKRNSR